MDEKDSVDNSGTETIEPDQTTMLVKKEGRQVVDPSHCPGCKTPCPPDEVFCRNCGATLKEFEIRDQRASLEQGQAWGGRHAGRHAATLDGRAGAQGVVRRTSTYLGKIRRIEPIPMRFNREEERKRDGSYESAVLIIGVVSISLLAVVVVVLVLLLVRYL